MPIVNMVSNNAADFPEGAYCPLKYKAERVVIYESHHGLCLSKRENNGYDDSDFYMTVWNPETQTPQEICFASTRGWTYPCYGSRVDASETTLAAYAKYVEKRNAEIKANVRAKQALALLSLRKELNQAGCLLNMTPNAIMRVRVLRKNMTHKDFSAITHLLKTNLRSEFKISLRQQVIDWAENSDPKYATPLSKKQLQYL